MNTVEAFNRAGKELKELLLLRFPPIAFKLIFSEDEIPEGSVLPLRDTGRHVAMCRRSPWRGGTACADAVQGGQLVRLAKRMFCPSTRAT